MPFFFSVLIFKCPILSPSTSTNPYTKKNEITFLSFKIRVMAIRTFIIIFFKILNKLYIIYKKKENELVIILFITKSL